MGYARAVRRAARRKFKLGGKAAGCPARDAGGARTSHVGVLAWFISPALYETGALWRMLRPDIFADVGRGAGCVSSLVCRRRGGCQILSLRATNTFCEWMADSDFFIEQTVKTIDRKEISTCNQSYYLPNSRNTFSRSKRQISVALKGCTHRPPLAS